MSQKVSDISDNHMAILERFVILMYDRTCDLLEVNEARQHLFTRTSRPIDTIPPTQAALREHIKRAVYQGGHIWGQAYLSSSRLPDPSQWGWTKNSDKQWAPKWTTLLEASQSCQELLKCGCVKGCKGRCKCYKAALKCTALCKCNGICDNE